MSSTVETFAETGAAVAILTAIMPKSFLPLLLLLALPALADDWSLGVGTGPFVFGKFAERTLRASDGMGNVTLTKTKLSAATRPGLVVDFEHGFNDRFAVRLQGTFTDAPLSVKPASGTGVSLDAGHIDVTTLTLPLVIYLNPHGRFRFHIKGGPAYAFYRIKGSPGTATPFEGTRDRFGGAAAAGVVWWWSNRFAVEGEVIDVVTASPFERSDFVGPASISIPKTQNGHATVGLRWKF